LINLTPIELELVIFTAVIEELIKITKKCFMNSKTLSHNKILFYLLPEAKAKAKAKKIVN
jgi:hypothetical protein